MNSTTGKELSQLDYDHWCQQVGCKDIKVYKDEISYFKDGKKLTVLKSNLVASPVIIEVRL